MIKSGHSRVFNSVVLISALGYFVDIYDLLIFSIVRVSSLRDLGVADDQLLPRGVLLLNAQMIGLLIGGIAWGIIGDKRGRLAVLFGSIFLYSVANLANAFVHSVEVYALFRFIAGLGLAGELGAAITLVCEVMPKNKRGYGTALVAGIGIMGAVFAAIISDLFSWRWCFGIGGVMGLVLLVLRFKMAESGLFEATKTAGISRGDFLSLFRTPKIFAKYLNCILIGMPLWFVVGILITFAPELGKELEIVGGIPAAGRAVLFSYFGLAVGDVVSGFLSQKLGSRRGVLALFLGMTAIASAVYLTGHGLTLNSFYVLCAVLGFCSGFWAIFITVASEQFGTNLRATVTTTAPNFVRGAVVPMTLAFQFIAAHSSRLLSAAVVGAVVISLAAWSIYRVEETHDKDLDYLE